MREATRISTRARQAPDTAACCGLNALPRARCVTTPGGRYQQRTHSRKALAPRVSRGGPANGRRACFRPHPQQTTYSGRVHQPSSRLRVRSRRTCEQSLSRFCETRLSPMVGSAAGCGPASGAPRTVTLMRNAASIAVAATADHGGANSHRTMEALSVVSHVGNSEDYGCGQCRRLGRSSKTEGRQDDSLQRESTRRPFAVSGLRSWSTICASRIIATCCSCRCRRTPQTGMGAGSVLAVGRRSRSYAGAGLNAGF